MSLEMISLLTVILLFVFFLMGLEIGFSMALAGFIGFAWIVNVPAALSLVAKDILQCLFFLWLYGHTPLCPYGPSRRQRRHRPQLIRFGL